jgi:flagellar hook protein FlgE
MSFQQGLSGLNAASKQLEVIGNNVSNATTVGFKQARAEFADMYASSLTGSGASQIGIGTKVSNISQQYTQGNVTSTSNPLDIAINGGGFFCMSTNGAITYSRNGQFQMDKLGYIVDSSNKRLTGYGANTSGVLSTGVPTELNISTSDSSPTATSKVTALVNLDSREPLLATSAFNSTDPTTYNNSTALTVFDSLGNAHTLQSFFVKTSATGNWDVYNSMDGATTVATAIGALPATPKTAAIAFSTSGITPTITPSAPVISFTPSGAAPIAIAVDYSGSTQFGSNFSINNLAQNGYTSGRLASFNTSADGMIIGRYSNGQSKTLGQVILANFVNPNGLQSLGGNAWSQTALSGDPQIGAPNTATLGVLQSSAQEDSNVDLTAELVNMITAQRIYQANAQTIKTQDQVLQTLVNLR